MIKIDGVRTNMLIVPNKQYVDTRNAVLRTYVNEQDAQVRLLHVYLAGDTIRGN